nr:DUF4011 domain-containing protein [Acholeplasmatales bacterium]
MENIVAYVKLFSKSGQIIEKPYLSNIEVKENDLVYVEGIELPVYVSKVVKVSDELSFDINSLHKVIKISLDDKNIYMDKDIDNIDFLNIFKINLNYQIKDYFSYADYHADTLYYLNNKIKSRLSFFEKLNVSNKENKEFFNMSLEFKFDSDIFKASPIYFNKIYAGESKDLELPFIDVDYEKLIKLNEIIVSHLELTLKTEGKILSRIDHVFKVFPISQPSINVLSDDKLYLKYITPNSNKVKQYTLNIKRSNNQSFIGYQNEDINDRYKEIKDVYNSLHNFGLTYYNPPKGGVYVDDLGNQQRLRLPDEVLKDKSGTCIDLALCFSSIYENIGYNTVLVLTDNHAYMGVFLKNKDEIKKDIFTSGAITSEAVLYNYITSGSNDLILIDTVYSTRDKNYSLDEVINITTNNLKDHKSGFKCYDVNYFHTDNGMYRSIPTSNEEYELFLEQKPLKIIESENKVFENITYNDILEQPIKDRFTFWENKLLDLDESNPLVNFKLSTSNTIRISTDSNLLSLLETDSKIKILGMNMPDNKKLYECLLESGKPENYIYSADKEKVYGFGLDSTMKNIIKKSKEAQDETGAPTLYLILGTLKFKRENKEKAIAPFMVLPVSIIKNKTTSSYEMTYDFDDLMLNKTFFEYYKLYNSDFNFDYLYNLSSDIKYQDVVHKFKMENKYDISLDSEHFLITNLTFSHYIMWLDIVKRKEELKRNKIIDSIICNTNKLNEPDLLFDSDKDELEDYNSFSAPLPYDSTQLKAVMDSAQGRSFILDGPPGTGKSQTIVNMMVNAIRLGKSVLFVAEKKAALDVVYKRLENIKLDRFALELHSNKANKSEFFKKLGESMDLGETAKPNDYEEKLQNLKIKKLELLNIINKIHKNKFYFSLYECIELYLNNDSKIINLDNKLIYSYDDDKHKEIIDLLNELYDVSYQITDFDNSLIKLLGFD